MKITAEIRWDIGQKTDNLLLLSSAFLESVENSMSLILSDEILMASGLSETELTLEIIIMLFRQKRISIGKAAHLARMPLLQFQHELASRQIPVHYEVEDLETDLKNLREMS